MHAAVGREGSVVFKWVVTGIEHSLYPPTPPPQPHQATPYTISGVGSWSHRFSLFGRIHHALNNGVIV